MSRICLKMEVNYPSVTKMTLNYSLQCQIITDEILSLNPPDKMTDTPSISSNPSSSSPFIHSTPFQNGKRCGVIFIDSGSSTRGIEPSFIVVKGVESHIWSLPKGRTEDEHETEEKCAIREVREETGIELFTTMGMPRIVIGRNVYFVYHTTRERFTEFRIHDKKEVGEVAWKTTSELRKMTCNKDLRAVLRYPQHQYPYHQQIFNTSLANTFVPRVVSDPELWKQRAMRTAFVSKNCYHKFTTRTESSSRFEDYLSARMETPEECSRDNISSGQTVIAIC